MRSTDARESAGALIRIYTTRTCCARLYAAQRLQRAITEVSFRFRPHFFFAEDDRLGQLPLVSLHCSPATALAWNENQPNLSLSVSDIPFTIKRQSVLPPDDPRRDTDLDFRAAVFYSHPLCSLEHGKGAMLCPPIWTVRVQRDRRR